MNRRRTPAQAVALVCLAAAALGGCGKAQPGPAGERLKSSDATPWSGTTSTSLAPGWKGTGDATTWNEQMRQRARGQNEYPSPQ